MKQPKRLTRREKIAQSKATIASEKLAKLEKRVFALDERVTTLEPQPKSETVQTRPGRNFIGKKDD